MQKKDDKQNNILIRRWAAQQGFWADAGGGSYKILCIFIQGIHINGLAAARFASP